MPQQSPRCFLNNIVEQYYPESDWTDYEELMKCIKRGCKRSVIALLDKGCRVVRPGTLNTPLHLAVERTGWAFIVKRLLERGARVNFVNAKNNTALHHAFLCEAPDMSINSMAMNYLRETNVNLVNSEGVTYLHIVCARSKLTYVKELLNDTDVDVNAQVSMNSKSAYAGFTALHFAVEYDKLDIAAYLLNNYASVYVQDANGSTPLHLACYRRNVQMIDLLLANDRAHINVIDNLGTSHFVAACMSSKTIFVKQYMIAAYRRFNVSPMSLVSWKMCDSLAYPFPGYTPLHFAASYGDLETVKMLLYYGAFCCTRAATGETAFTLAMKLSRKDICDVLQRHCEDYQTRLSNQVKQSQSTARSVSSPETSLVDGRSYQDYSSPDTTYSSALQPWEQCVTPIDLSSSNYQYDFNF